MTFTPAVLSSTQIQELKTQINQWGQELGFQHVGFSDIHLKEHEHYLNEWLKRDYHGDMEYMGRHGSKRSRPAELLPGTISIISVRMNYMPPNIDTLDVLNSPEKAYISRYALGRDYHKLLRKRLSNLAKYIQTAIGPYGYRAFVDSAPVLEKAIAEKADLGWIGKNTLLLNRSAGSYFFLGELFTDLPLVSTDKSEEKNLTSTPPTTHQPNRKKNHCGSCTSCLDLCPTKAIVAPYELDARRCISYLTIEYKGSIPLELRPMMGNRVFGCDDCQLVCPWNRFSQITEETDFHPRHHLEASDLCELFLWDQKTFEKKTEGSPIRRSGYACWLRNLSIGLGNSPSSERVISTLKTQLYSEYDIVREHVNWALEQHAQFIQEGV